MMATYEQSTEVHAEPDALFAYLSDVTNLATYMESMTSAELVGDGKIRTAAQVDVDHDGTTEEVGGESWFTVNDGDKRMEWGSEGPNNYSGKLEVSGQGNSATVSVAIQTEHTGEGADIEQGLKATLATIKRLVEVG